MCDHPLASPFMKANSIGDPKDPDCCNIYYIHQDGSIFCHQKAVFSDEARGIRRLRRAVTGREDVDDGGNTEKFKNSRAFKSEGDLTNGENIKNEGFCGDDRLTLVHLPSPTKDDPKKPVTANPQQRVERRSVTKPDLIPAYFEKKLKDICPYCHCKKNILWHNYHRDEQHFDACFRYVDDPFRRDRRCFLKLYTLKVPFLSDLIVTFSMVHHIRAEGSDFARASHTKGGNQEHMLAFISGLESRHIKDLLTGLVYRWQDIAHDHLKTSVGMTPRLFVAALLSQYGSITSVRIRDAYIKLQNCDRKLKDEIPLLEVQDSESSPASTACIHDLSKRLVDMNIQLTGTRSVMHYLADSANVLVNNITPFEAYVKARLAEWNDNRDVKRLRRSLRKLDSCREQIRDNDKLIMVRKTMTQYKTDIKSLQQHIDINVGMVTNLIAERDRSIQQLIARSQASNMIIQHSIAKRQEDILEEQKSIAQNTAQDGSQMKIMAFLTAVFLPATFMAVFLTTPMFNFIDRDKGPVLVKLPFGVYFGVTGFATIMFGAGLHILDHPKKMKKYMKLIDGIRSGFWKTQLTKGLVLGWPYRVCEARTRFLKRSNSLNINSGRGPDAANPKHSPSVNGPAGQLGGRKQGKSARSESSEGSSSQACSSGRARLPDEERGTS